MEAGDISYFARTNHRAQRIRFGIKQADRLSHIYIIGKTGTGKSSLIETFVGEDLRFGHGFALIDPHGDLVERVASGALLDSSKRVIYINASDSTQTYGYNPLRRVRDDKIPLAASGFIETLKKLWHDAWGVRMEHILRNCLYALLERSDATLPDILRLLTDDAYRKQIAGRIRNEVVRRFWQDEFESYHFRQKADAIAPIQNKLGALLSNPTLYRILVRPDHDVHMRSLMDEGDILLVNLSKGKIGEDSATVLGSLLVSTIALAAFSRAEVPEGSRRPFFLYVDEFQNFTTLMFANMMSELRKYGIGLTLANQHFHQLDVDVRHAVLGNAATLVSFRVGPEDAMILAREFQPRIDVVDLVALPNRNIYLKLMIDGTPSRPFSAELL